MPSSAAAVADPARRGPVTPIGYSPVQQRVIDILGRRAGQSEHMDTSVAVDVREYLELALADAAERVPDGESLWLGKSHLHSFATCPGGWHAGLDAPFRWTIATVRGTVSHKAIELTLNWRGEAEPARMVDAAIAHIIDQGFSAGKYLRQLTTVELAELRSASIELVTAFEECFPPLRSRWRPVLEGRLRTEVAAGKIVLTGRPDLMLGQAARGGKVIVDLKTGRRSSRHAEDLRFYALIDTLRVGVAPRRIATVYLDAGQPEVETVTPELLLSAAERLATLANAMIGARWGGDRLELRTGPQCGWCPVRAGCAAGQEWEQIEDGDRERW